MRNKIKYIIIKKKLKKKKSNFNSKEVNGFELTKDKKKNINGAVIVNIKLYHKEFIDYSINKKMQKKIKKLLELIASIFENDDDPGEQMLIVLNEVEKFKRMIINQYALFMSKKQMVLLQKKLELIENEIKNKMKNIPVMVYDKEEEKEKSGRRRR